MWVGNGSHGCPSNKESSTWQIVFSLFVCLFSSSVFIVLLMVVCEKKIIVILPFHFGFSLYM